MKIEYIEEKHNYNQAYSSGVKMTLISNKNKQLKPFFFCADYFNECVAAEITKEKKSIYGFSYDPVVDVMSKRNFKVLMTSDKDKFENKIDNITKFLNGFEKKIKIPLSKVSFAPDHPVYGKNVILIVANNKVKNSVLLLTAWRVILRNASESDVNLTFDENFEKFLTGGNKIIGHGDGLQFPRIKQFLEYLKKDKQYPLYRDEKNYSIPTLQLHSNSGLAKFSNLITGAAKPEYPWEKRIVEKIS